MSEIMFTKPKGLENVIKSLSNFTEQIGFTLYNDKLYTNKVSATYKITANMKIEKSNLNDLEIEKYDFGIISIPKFQKVLDLFKKESNDKDKTVFLISEENDMKRLYISNNKKLVSMVISELITPDNNPINKSESLFTINLNEEIISFIKQSSKIVNIPVLQIALDRESDKVYLVIGDINDTSEYISRIEITDYDSEDVEVLKQSKIASLFEENEEYTLIIKYNLNDIVKALSSYENLFLSLLLNGAMIITDKDNDNLENDESNYTIDYGFIPIQ